MLSIFTVSTIDGSGAGSLREAIELANATPEQDTIEFSVAGTINIASELPELTDPDGTIIDGRTAPGYVDQPVVILDGSAAGNVSGLKIAALSGEATDGANEVRGLEVDSFSGGGIRNYGGLIVSNCTLLNNGNGSDSFDGGGIYNEGTLTITNATISENWARNGGGVYNLGGLTVANSTLSENSARYGAGIYNAADGTLAITNSTLSNNSGTSGPQAYFSFDVSTDPGRDDSGSGHHGTVNGASWTEEGVLGGALSFDGDGDYVEVPYGPALDVNQLTVSAWVNISSEPGAYGILGTRFGGDTTFDVKVQTSNIHGDIGTGAGWINTSLDINAGDTGSTGQGGDLEVGSWHLVTYVIDGDNHQAELYLDGDLKRKIGFSGNPRFMQPGQSMRIGNSWNIEYMHGRIDEVAIYDRALHAGAVAALYDDGYGAKPDQPAEGGAICNFGELTITHSTLTENWAEAGGGVYNTGALNFGHTILAGNTGTSGADCYSDTGSVSSQGHSLVGNNSDFAFTPATGDLVGTGGSPIDPLLGPLQDNGGRTLTQALLLGSPAIDAGGNTGTPQTDQRGYPRIVDGDSDGTAEMDIGAFELVPIVGLTGIDIGPDPGTNPLPGIGYEAGNQVGDQWVIRGDGNDIWDREDAFHYEYTSWTGDFDATVRAISLQQTNLWAKAGIMARVDLTLGSAHVMCIATPGEGSGHLQGREATDQLSFWQPAGGPNMTPDGSTPVWLRLGRQDNTFYSLWALDEGGMPGAWSPFEWRPVDNMPETINLGLAVTSHDAGLVTEARFDSFSIGPFMVDTTVEPYPVPLQLESPAGSLIYDGLEHSCFHTTGDVDVFTLDLDADQTVTAVLKPLGSSVMGEVKVFSPSGTSLGSAAASGEGLPAILQTLPAAAAGTYRVEATSLTGAGGYQLQIILNAAAEEELLLGMSNDSMAAAQSIDSSSLALQGTADRLAVLGQTDAGSYPSTDFYSFELAAGECATLALASPSPSDPARMAAMIELELLDSSGVVLARGIGGASNVDQYISDFLVPADGTYYARVTGREDHQYSLTLTRNASFGLDLPYFEDFEAFAGSEWSTTTTENSVPEFTRFLGRFSSDDALLTLPTVVGQSYRVEFDLYIIDSWDGNSFEIGPDYFDVFVDDSRVFHETFHSDGYSQTFRPPNQGGANLGFGSRPYDLDSIYRGITIPFTATSPTTHIRFADGGLEGLNDESWGIDNVRVAPGIFDISLTDQVLASSLEANQFQFQVSAGDALVLGTTTPGDGPGEPVNDPDPILELYDENGVLVATDDNGAGDGRNARINYTVPTGSSGTYRVGVRPAVALAATVQDFEGAGTPFTLTNRYGLSGDVLDGGPAGSFLRLTPAALDSLNTIAFDRTKVGPASKIVAEFDFRMTPGYGQADGFAFVLVDTAICGAEGAGPYFDEEAYVADSFGIGFDIYDNGEHDDYSNNRLSLHFDNVNLGNFDPGFDISNGRFHHAQITLKSVAGGSNITVTLTPDVFGTPGSPVIAISSFFVSGMLPYENRLAFGARTGDESAAHDLDNISVQYFDSADGTYTLAIDGATGIIDEPPVVVGGTLPDGARFPSTPTIPIELVLSEAIRADSVEPTDLVIDGGAVATGVELLDGRTVRFTVAVPDIEGIYTYSLPAGALIDLQGQANLEYQARFLIDDTGPRAVLHSPGGDVTGTMEYVDVWFSEKIDPATFTIPQGLLGEYYNFDPQIDNGRGGWTAFDSLANLNALLDPLTPNVTQILHQAIDFPVGGGNDATDGNPLAGIGINVGNDQFVARWTGQINITRPGPTQFFTASDDCSVLFIDGEMVVDNNYFQAIQERTGTIDLTEGLHDIVVAWCEKTGGAGITVSWIPNGGSKELVPPEYFPFDLPDVRITDPNGQPVAVSTIEEVGLNRFRISFPPQTTVGTYHVSVGPDIRDLVGNQLDQDRDGIFGEPGDDVYDATFNLVPVDLQLANPVVGPSQLWAGEPATVSWDGTNTTGAPLLGDWTDAVYLSADDQWDIGDTLLATVPHTGGLAQGQSYHQSVEVFVPGALPGEYYIIVRADLYNQEREAGAEGNNVAAVGPILLDFRELPTDGMPLSGSLTSADRSNYYVIDVGEGEHLQITLDDANDLGSNALYVRYGQPPTRSEHDYRHSTNFAPDQQIQVPYTQLGRYYVMVHGESVPDAPGQFTLSADLLPFAITEVSPSSAPNVGEVTFEVKGYRLLGAASFTMEGPAGQTLTPVSTQFTSGGDALLTFDMAGTDAGDYELRGTPAVAASMASASTILWPLISVQNVMIGVDIFEWLARLPSKLEYEVIGPSVIRPGQDFRIRVNYANAGESNMVAPLFLVQGPPDLSLSIADATTPRTDPISYVGDGYGQTRIPGIPASRPNGSGWFDIEVEVPRDTPAGSYCFDVGVALVNPAVGIESQASSASLGALSVSPSTSSDASSVELWTYRENQWEMIDDTADVDPTRSTDIIVHGWRNGRRPGDPPGEFREALDNNDNAKWMREMAEAILAMDPARQVILVDAGPYLNTGLLGFLNASDYVDDAAIELASDLGVLGFPGSGSLHFIGHSLGAHVAAEAARHLGSVEHVTGLDSAILTPLGGGSYFRRGCADYVDYYRTSPLGRPTASWLAHENFDVQVPEWIRHIWNIDDQHGYAHEWYTDTIRNKDITEYGYHHNSAGHLPGWRGAVYQNGALLDWDARHWDRPGLTSEIPTVHSRQFCVQVVRSWDPNEKVGPGGYTDAYFVRPQMMPYTVYFENDPELATAPAQEVRITDVLDEDLDLSTFELTEIAFANHVIDVPAGMAHYETTVDLRPEGIPVLVQVDVGLDPETRQLAASFVAVDPDTGIWPEDPLVGLLYPNDETGRGEGHISYLIKPLSGLPSGTQITNQASIVFDYNDPIDTPQVLNTVDAAPPASQVAALPPWVDDTSVMVSWTGEDEPGGAGLAHYDIYVSDDAGPFTLWLDDTTETSALFTGQDGHSYAFYSIAADNVGHREAAPETPDAVTLLMLNQPPVAVIGGPYFGEEGSAVVFDASGSSDPDGVPLQYRWDFDNDGIWDTEYSLEPTNTHTWTDDHSGTVAVEVYDGELTASATASVTVNNVAPALDDASFAIPENSPEGTPVGTVTGTDPSDDMLTYSITGGTGQSAFAIDPATGLITVGLGALLDFETTPSLTLEVQVADDDAGTGTAQVTIDLLNQPSISGAVFVDVNQNGLYEANEPGIDGVAIELLDGSGSLLSTTTTSDGGCYLFDDLDPGTYRVHEVQPTGVDDGAEILGSLSGTIPTNTNDTMELTLVRVDAADYLFAELGQQVTSGDTATIGFWQNKHGQDLIARGGTALAAWLTANFDNVFGNTFADGVDGDDGLEVAAFFKDQLFRQKSNKSAGPAKVDAQFMAVALATYFTSNDLAADMAAGYGFNVTDTGIGTKVVNVGTNGSAFGELDNTDLTIMQLLWATNDLTDNVGDGSLSGFAHIYDRDGNGVIDSQEAALRAMANDVYSMINEQGDE